MKRLASVVISLSLFSVTLLSGISGAAVRSVREGLVSSASFTAVYSVDDYLTMATVAPAASEAEVFDGFKALCKESGKELERVNGASDAEAYRCSGSFSVSNASGSFTEEGSRSFLVRHSDAQPTDYRTPVIPSYSKLTPPPSGKLKYSYAKADLYEYLYVLCKKENGTPAFVIPRRHGKFVRMTRVAPAEAFNYLMTSNSGKEAWYAACEGEKSFMLEKEYKYSSNEPESLIFHSNRGLEGISFVKGEETPSYLSRLDAVIADDAINAPGTTDFLREMAWEVAYMKTDFVKTLDGDKYTGSYEPEVESCGLVTITRKSEAVKDLSGKTVFRYNVCDDARDTRLSALIPVVRTLLASWSR